jgi:hypothetical protein
MSKGKINITMDRDLIEFAKDYAEEQRTTVSEVITQFILYLKRNKVVDPTEIILKDPVFSESLIETLTKIRSGKMRWFTYDEVFK